MMIKVMNIICDVITAILLVLFCVLIIASPTLGTADFHIGYYESDEVTVALQENLKEKTDAVAEQTGVDPEAFVYAVGPIKIDTVKNQIVQAIFSGNNYDYSDSSGIEESYREGIKEYYRFNGLDIDDATLNKAVRLACNAFNETLGVSNNSQLAKFVVITSTHSMIAAIVVLVLLVFFVTRIFALNMGRTKSFAHIGCVLVSAGFSLVIMFVLDFVVDFADKLYLTNNEIINGAISQATGKYFFILAVFGIAFIGLGITAFRFVYQYYVKKLSLQSQEMMINKKIMLENKITEENGEINL